MNVYCRVSVAARLVAGAWGRPRPGNLEAATMTPPARTPEQRKADTLSRLERDTDAWVATADPGSGTPYMVPLSFLWDGATVLIATPAASPTSRNLQATGKVRLGIGPTRDLVLIEGTVQAVTAAADIPAAAGDAFAVKTGFDPRELTDAYAYFHISPRRVQAWREVNELAGRDLMRGGVWVTR
jgi:nitroimidazol reductase NimA-like FMN-containing flavoprotein (pyridoxamine 5'-phosphate oxidase superfamily)